MTREELLRVLNYIDTQQRNLGQSYDNALNYKAGFTNVPHYDIPISKDMSGNVKADDVRKGTGVYSTKNTFAGTAQAGRGKPVALSADELLSLIGPNVGQMNPYAGQQFAYSVPGAQSSLVKQVMHGPKPVVNPQSSYFNNPEFSRDLSAWSGPGKRGGIS